MSARVVNPFSLTEMRRLREAVVVRPVAFRPDPEARARVARNLWGCASSAESRAFASRELEVQRERASERWGFDFVREVPRAHGPGAGRYQWRPVKVGSVPAAYRMPRLNLDKVLETARATVVVREPAQAAQAARQPEPSATAATADEDESPLVPLASPDTPPSATASASSSSTSTSTSTPPVATRQTTLKDFMGVRKRPRSEVSIKSEDFVSHNAAKRARPSTN